jgi:rare lipoprotein A
MKTQLEELGGNLHVFARDGLYRVHAGPYANQSEARQAAERINRTLGVRPVVVTR